MSTVIYFAWRLLTRGETPSSNRGKETSPSTLFYGNGGTKFSKWLNREHAR